jgi:hypothetical protein
VVAGKELKTTCPKVFDPMKRTNFIETDPEMEGQKLFTSQLLFWDSCSIIVCATAKHLQSSWQCQAHSRVHRPGSGPQALMQTSGSTSPLAYKHPQFRRKALKRTLNLEI